MHAALHTPLVDLLGCSVPIISAGMGGVARHELAAAVSNAGGFGCLGMVREPVALIRHEVQAYRALSERPFAVNLIPAATPTELLTEQVRVCLELQVPAIALFWD
ncbi:TPA: nitronate monooxygenase, partial [Pseudomonas aeruginosa]|nr:nitronate monooxygenase [Pseudomonas aeruginosa]